MAKLGTYGIIRFDLNLFPQASRTLAPVLLTLAVIGILYGAIVACAQRDLKRLLAYSSLAQIGFIALGTFALNSQGLSGGVLQMVNHGLVIATLFILVGLDLRAAQDLAGRLAAGAAVAGAGPGRRLHAWPCWPRSACPVSTGSSGEFLVLIGTFVAHRWWAVAATGGVIVAAIYLLWGYQQVFHGEPAAADAGRATSSLERTARRGPAHRAHRVPRRLPQAGARPDHPVGQPAGDPRGPGDRHHQLPARPGRRAAVRAGGPPGCAEGAP